MVLTFSNFCSVISESDNIRIRYITDVVKQHTTDEKKVGSIVSFLANVKTFGNKTAQNLSDHAGISIGLAFRIVENVKEVLKAQFSTSRPLSQTQRMSRYLKDKGVKR